MNSPKWQTPEQPRWFWRTCVRNAWRSRHWIRGVRRGHLRLRWSLRSVHDMILRSLLVSHTSSFWVHALVPILFLPSDAVRWRGICYGDMAVCLSVCLSVTLIIIIIINRFVYRRKVITSEALTACQWAEKEEKAWEKRNVFSLNLKTAKESLLRTVFGSEFQTAGAEHRKARFAIVVVVEGWRSAVVVDRRLCPCSRS